MFKVDGEKAGETEAEREARKARRTSLIEKAEFAPGTSVRPPQTPRVSVYPPLGPRLTAAARTGVR